MNDDTVQGKSLDDRIAEATSTEEVGEQVENQPEPMPSSEQKQTEEQETPVEAEHEGEDLELPEGVSERTRKEFEKLKARLAEAEAKITKPETLEFGDSVFDTFRPQQGAPVNAEAYGNLNQQQVDSITSRFVDDEGNVDIAGLDQALQTANQRAERAERAANQAVSNLERFEESQQVREAHAVHPWLDPKSPEFDPVRFELVRDRILRLKYFEGQNVSLLEAADAIAKTTSSSSPVNLDKVSEEAVVKYKESQEKRQQGPIESGKGEPRDTQDYSELREKTRFENPSDDAPALTERLANLGIIKKDS